MLHAHDLCYATTLMPVQWRRCLAFRPASMFSCRSAATTMSGRAALPWMGLCFHDRLAILTSIFSTGAPLRATCRRPRGASCFPYAVLHFTCSAHRQQYCKQNCPHGNQYCLHAFKAIVVASTKQLNNGACAILQASNQQKSLAFAGKRNVHARTGTERALL